MMRSALLTRACAAGIGAATAIALSVSAALAGATINAAAPDFEGVDSNGQTFQLSSLQGQKVILEWTNHKCPYVKKHYETENMQSLQAKAREEGYTWVSIISSAPGKQGHVSGEEANELTQNRNASPDKVILDESGEIGRLYGAKTTPHMFVIDGGGVVRYMGAIDDKPSASHETVTTATNYVQAAMGHMAQSQPVSEPVTTPYGCSVKY